MNYYELTLQLEPYNEEISEIVIAEFADLGCDSFVDIENGVNAYIPENVFDKNKVDELVESLSNIAKISYTSRFVEAQNWNAVWESNFEAIVIDERCTIRAPFHNNLPQTEYEIVIMPKMSFGTGHHATTYLVAEALLDLNVENLNVLDMGCGTGILAILAAMKNAKHIDAIDNDDWAYENAIENVSANNANEKINVMLGDASLLSGKSYDLILANINRNILLADMQQYASALKRGGKLIVSGVFTEDISIVETEAAKYNLRKIETKNRDKWARIQFAAD